MNEGLFVLPEDGFFIKGKLSGMDEKISEYEGVRRVTYRYLIVAGMESFLLSSDLDYRELLQIGETVTFTVTPRVFGQKVYYTRAGIVQ